MDEIMTRVLEMGIYASVMILLLLALRFVFKDKIKANIISALWILVLIRLVVPVTFESPMHLDKLFKTPIAIQSNTRIPVDTDTALGMHEALDAGQPDFAGSGQIEGYEYADETAKSANFEPAFFGKVIKCLDALTLTDIAFIVWITGAIVFLLVNAVNILRFMHRIRRCRHGKSKILEDLLSDVRAFMGIKSSAKITECEYVDTPVVVGAVSPKILIPIGLKDSLDKSSLRLIIMHELLHIKRKDILKNYIWIVAKAVHWFNPLVWLAHDAYLGDLEISLDNMVMHRVSESCAYRYAESIIKTLRMSNQRAKNAATVSFCRNKGNIRKRVENMINPSKKLKSASVVAGVIVIIMLVSCFTTACQPSAAGNETIETADTQISVETDEAVTDSQEEEKAYYPTPETYENYFERGGVKVYVDASILGPENKKVPSVIVEPVVYGQEMLDKFLDYFVGDANLYMKSTYYQTKSQIDEEIAYWEQAIENCKTSWDDVRLNDPYAEHDKSEDAIAEFKSFISRLKGERANAPDKVDYIEIDRELTKREEDSEEKELIAFAQNTEGDFDDMAYIVVFGTLEDEIWSLNYSNYGAFSTSRKTKEDVASTTGLSLEDAVAQVEEAAAYFGIEDLYLETYSIANHTKNGVTRPYYNINMYPTIGSIEMPKLGDETQLRFDDGNPYTTYKVPTPNCVNAYVDETGIIMFSFGPPDEIIEVINDDVVLFPFDDIIKIFEEELMDTLFVAESGKREVFINQIALSLMPTTNDEGVTVKCVPVWDFRGYFYNPESEVWINSETRKGGHSQYSFLTVNAETGSIIARRLGY